MVMYVMIEYVVVMVLMECLFRDEFCCDWLVSVFWVVGRLCVFGIVMVCFWFVKLCEDDCMWFIVELLVCCDVFLLVVLVINGFLDLLEMVCGFSFDVIVEEDVWVFVDVDDLFGEMVVDLVKRVNFVVVDLDVEDKFVVNDGGNVVCVVKIVGFIVEVDWVVDDFLVCFVGIDFILVVWIFNVEDVCLVDVVVDSNVNNVWLDFIGGVCFVVDVLDFWFGVIVGFVVVFVVIICFWVVNFVGCVCLVVVVLGGCCVEVVICIVVDVEDVCLFVSLGFRDIVLGFLVLDVVVFVVGVIVVIIVDDVWIGLLVVGFI